MKLLIAFVFALSISVSLAQEGEETPPATIIEAVPEPVCEDCPQISVQHYTAKQCTPVYDREINPCCPISYNCPPAVAYSNTATTCRYMNKTYSVGDQVPVEGPCRKSCICTPPIDNGYIAEIVCAQVECPQSNVDIKPGCRLVFNETECCATGMECGEVVPEMAVVQNENATYREADCTWEGHNYFYGDIMTTTTTPCQHCVCNKDFTDAFGPGCVKIDCGLDYKFSELLKADCVPLYSEKFCCPSDWVCPDGEFVINIPNPEHTQSTEEVQCSLGNITAPVMQSVPTFSCTINCVCLIPPEFTCIEYPTCEQALLALHAGVLP